MFIDNGIGFWFSTETSYSTAVPAITVYDGGVILTLNPFFVKTSNCKTFVASCVPPALHTGIPGLHSPEPSAALHTFCAVATEPSSHVFTVTPHDLQLLYSVPQFPETSHVVIVSH